MQVMLSFFLVIVSFVFVLITVRKYPSINILLLLVIPVAYVIRPSAALYNGSTLLTLDLFDKSVYMDSFLYASISLFMFSVGMFLAQILERNFRYKIRKACEYDKTIVLSKTSVKFVAIGSIMTALLFLFIGGGSVIITNRVTSISVVSPILRYIYPIGLVLMGVGIVHAIVGMYVGKHKYMALAYLLMQFMMSSLYGTRGFAIAFALIGFGLVFMSQPQRAWRKLILGSTIILFLFLLKDLLFAIFVGTEEVGIGEHDLIESVLRRPDGDTTEVWMVLLQYLRGADYLYGATIVNNLFNFLPHIMRGQLGLMNGQDILNDYFNPQGYWTQGFGFNVTLPVELYLNFGALGFPLMSPFGYFLGREIISFFHHVFNGKCDPGVHSLRLYAAWTLANSLAGLQWALLFSVAFMLLRRSAPTFRPKRDAISHRAG